jgi:aryl-alcohol dehydrogenase-like predicted oxidoreductase
VGEHYDDARGFWYDYSPPAVQSSIEQSLRRLQTDYIDVIQIHSASQEIVERGEVLEVMQRFRQAGHVRFLGLSCGEDAARAAIDSGQYDTIQVDYNILDQTMAGSVFPQASERDVGVVIMAPLAHGALTAKQDFLEPDNPLRRKLQELRFLIRPDQTLAQAALRFVLACDAVSTLIAGTRKRENLRGNVEAADEPLSAEDRERIEDLYQRDFGLLETG